jgi:hypothetical protein
MMIVPFIFFAILTLNNKVFGSDAWYWLQAQSFPAKPVFFNIISVAMWFYVIFLFSFAENKKQNWIFIACLFLLNLFSLRFLEVEFDDFIFYNFSFVFILIAKRYDVHKLLSLLIISVWIILHISVFYLPTNYSELILTPVAIIFIMPTIFLLLLNRKWKDLAILIVLAIVFMSGKFVSNYLPLFVFAVYLDFLTKNDFKHIMGLSLLFLVMFYMVFTVVLTQNIDKYQKALSFCDISNKTCDDKNDLANAHFFAWLGYKSQTQICKCL